MHISECLINNLYNYTYLMIINHSSPWNICFSI